MKDNFSKDDTNQREYAADESSQELVRVQKDDARDYF